MSRLYWHTQHEGTTELLGAEYAHMQMLVQNVAQAALPMSQIARRHMTTKAFNYFGPYDDAKIRLFFGSSDGVANPMFVHQGEGARNYEVALNTALAVGNDVLALFARLSAQAHHHAYVEGPQRAWLANVVQQGLASGVCRSQIYAHDEHGHPHSPRPSGWVRVIELLLASAVQPVVLSYSVDQSFPDSDLCGVDPDDDDALNAWEALGDDIKWAQSIEALRKRNEEWLLELNPDNLHAPFAHCVSLFDIFNE